MNSVPQSWPSAHRSLGERTTCRPRPCLPSRPDPGGKVLLGDAFLYQGQNTTKILKELAPVLLRLSLIAFTRMVIQLDF